MITLKKTMALLKTLNGEHLIDACQLAQDTVKPNMTHIRDLISAESYASLEHICLYTFFNKLRNGADIELAKEFMESYNNYCKFFKQRNEVPESNTLITFSLADVVEIMLYDWEHQWQESHSTPSHIDDRAPGLVVYDAHYAAQEEIIDMVNNGHLKVQVKN